MGSYPGSASRSGPVSVRSRPCSSGHRRAALGLAGRVRAPDGRLGDRPDAGTAGPARPGCAEGLFALNLAAVPLVAFLFVRLFAGDRAGALATVRRVVEHYFSPDLAEVLLADPGRAELGGEIAQVTVLFADLGELLDLRREAGAGRGRGDAQRLFRDRPAGDPRAGRLADSARRRRDHGRVRGPQGPGGSRHPSVPSRARPSSSGRKSSATGPQPGPRFHIGVNSGPALVGNIGSEAYRNFTAIGDTTNLAARLQDVAKPGEVVVGPLTAAQLDGAFALSSLGSVTVKGRTEPTEVFDLRSSGERRGASPGADARRLMSSTPSAAPLNRRAVARGRRG